jgi:hypothetical protein
MDIAMRRYRKVEWGVIFSYQIMATTRSYTQRATIIKAAMILVAEAELGAIYLNAKKTVYLCQILTKMGHLQP